MPHAQYTPTSNNKIGPPGLFRGFSQTGGSRESNCTLFCVFVSLPSSEGRRVRLSEVLSFVTRIDAFFQSEQKFYMLSRIAKIKKYIITT